MELGVSPYHRWVGESQKENKRMKKSVKYRDKELRGVHSEGNRLDSRSYGACCSAQDAMEDWGPSVPSCHLWAVSLETTLEILWDNLAVFMALLILIFCCPFSEPGSHSILHFCKMPNIRLINSFTVKAANVSLGCLELKSLICKRVTKSDRYFHGRMTERSNGQAKQSFLDT